ncbi:hypothetical protein FDI61_gp092 [Mycobacterium phage Marvin]|uniref:Uncharacterized protein n=1 Tax=Mycobacterium phage Marvin TaxID=1034139 RepID=G1BNG2_9CAUD|nr:hypothetical protein FDI61_gp092 [Mycobacterium phage Marvin]AEJ95392.1 hypothetical protein MARVIN_92 [Mycobacterium phage Marvin]
MSWWQGFFDRHPRVLAFAEHVWEVGSAVCLGGLLALLLLSQLYQLL